MKISQSILENIGNTPIIRLDRFKKHYNLDFNLFAKIEYFNPAGSIKDRIAYGIISQAIKDGTINNDTVVIEPTSGNMGIGLAMICAVYGLKLIVVMPNNMSVERLKILKIYGCKVVLTDKRLGMQGAIEKANELKKRYENNFSISQFDNSQNPEIHYSTTAKEIFEDFGGNVDVLLAGVGTGGTISGIGKYLKERIPSIQVFAVEPKNSPLLSQNIIGEHNIQGIGAGFIPKVLDTSAYDKILTVKDDDAINTVKALASTEGIFAGISSGACLQGAIQLNDCGYKDKNVLTILPDNGEKYLSILP